MTRTAQSEWARLLFGSLARLGLRDVVISPGSRSTPFAWAALHTAELRCHSLWDERSAGFFALGQVRLSGRPTALLCTSGSAAAEYFPAVVEASHAFLPLVVLSADRPFELMDAGAAQTMNQVELYGRFVRHFADLGHPEATPLALDGLVRRVAQAVQLASGPTPGPVHLNLRARKPLEPVEAQSPDELALREAVDRRLQLGPTTRLAASSSADIELQPLVDACRTASRGLIVCGPLPANSAPRGLFALAAATGFPLCVEAASQARFAEAPSGTVLVGGFDALLSCEASAALEPELALIFGAPPTSASFERWRARTAATQIVVATHGWLDPSNRARYVVNGDATAIALELATKVDATSRAERGEHRAFAERWRRAEASYVAALRRVLAEGSAGAGLSEAVAVRVATEALPSGGVLGLGNSLPIRDVDAFVEPRARGFRVWSQRGVNGIDGLVSGAAGAAQVSGGPSLLLIGDVSLLHDVGGLAATRTLTTPLVLLLIDNGGGRIFQGLPLASAMASEPSLLRYWLTPPECDFSHAAALFGLPYERAEDEGALAAALERGFARPGPTLVHAVVEPDSAARTRQRLVAELELSLARELG